MLITDAFWKLFISPLELVFECIFDLAVKITQSEGIAIILLSLVVSTLVLPLYNRAEKIETEEREKEKELRHWADHIKKHFKGDERYMILDAYYRENGYSPIFQLRSSLSILLQIPFFLAAYNFLGIRMALRFLQVRFFVFSDLSEPDRLINLGSVSVNVMPILMTLINIIAALIYTRGLPIKTVLRSMILPLLFLVLLYNSPSSLLIYWTMNNVYSLVKTIIVKNAKKHKTADRIKPSKEKASGSAGGIFRAESKTSMFILPMLFLAVLTGLLIPSAYLSASPEEFIDITTLSNPVKYLIPSICTALGFFVIWPSVFYYLAGKKARTVISVIVTGVALSAIVNYLLFGGRLGTINTTLVFDNTPSSSLLQKMVNIVVLIAIMAACLYLYRFRKVLVIVFTAIILTALTISCLNIKKVQDSFSSVMMHADDFREDSSPKIVLSDSGRNVMVIMLDKAISGYIPYVFNEYPELKQQFDGFTYYPNSISFGYNTLLTSSALFGGYDYTPERIDQRADETLGYKHDEALKVLPVLFSSQGYVTTVMDLPYVGWTWNDDYSSFEDIDNCYTYHAKDYFSSDTEMHVNMESRRNRNMFMYSLFRTTPLLIRDVIYDDGNYLAAVEDTYDVYDFAQNIRVLENLSDMTVTDEGCEGALFVFNNEATHDTANLKDADPGQPYMFEEGYSISNGSEELKMWDPYQAATFESLAASMKELGNYFDYLRQIGVYDNTRIIIVSDHGACVELFRDIITDDVNAELLNCLLMAKDFDGAGLETDYSFMTCADVPTLATSGVIDDAANPFTGTPLDSALKQDDIYVCYSTAFDEREWNPDLNQGNTFFYNQDCRWYKVMRQDIFDEDNWQPAERPG